MKYATNQKKVNMKSNNVFNQISLTHSQILLFNKIKNKGRHEQEKQFLFPTLYGSKAVTRNEKGAWKQVENYLNKKTKREKKFKFYP
jgi:hypothetical protein